MFSKKRINISTTVILLLGLLAFFLCQTHPAIGDDHGSAAGADESCQIFTLPSAAIASPLLATPAQTLDHVNSLFIAFSALGLEWVFSNQVPEKTGPLILPLSTIKRYQLICTYRL